MRINYPGTRVVVEKVNNYPDIRVLNFTTLETLILAHWIKLAKDSQVKSVVMSYLPYDVLVMI